MTEVVHESRLVSRTHAGLSTMDVQVVTGTEALAGDVCPWCLEGPGFCPGCGTRPRGRRSR